MALSGQLDSPVALPHGITSPTRWLGDKVDPRAVLDDLVEEENSLPPSGEETWCCGQPVFCLVKKLNFYLSYKLHGVTSAQTIICFVVVASTYIKAGNMQDG